MSVSTKSQEQRINDSEVEEISRHSTGEVSDTSEPSLDVVFDVLRNRRRRLVLQAIEERNGSTTLSKLAEHIGGIENDKPPEALNAQERKRVYVALYQCHLPKMDDAEAIEFDKDRGTVERGELAERYHTYLNREVEMEPAWAEYYGALAGGACAVYVATVALGGPTTLVSFASLALIGAVSVYHWTKS